MVLVPSERALVSGSTEQSQLAANNIGLAQQKALVKSLMPMMKGAQRQRLQRILNMLGE
mgnify:FL=1